MSAITQLIVMETGIAARIISASIARVRISMHPRIAMKATALSHLILVVDQSAGLKALITAWTGRAARSQARVTRADSALRAGEKEGRRCHDTVMVTRVITIT